MIWCMQAGLERPLRPSRGNLWIDRKSVVCVLEGTGTRPSIWVKILVANICSMIGQMWRHSVQLIMPPCRFYAAQKFIFSTWKNSFIPYWPLFYWRLFYQYLKKKYSCPNDGRNVGAEKILSGEKPKKAKYRGGKKLWGNKVFNNHQQH